MYVQRTGRCDVRIYYDIYALGIQDVAQINTDPEYDVNYLV